MSRPVTHQNDEDSRLMFKKSKLVAPLLISFLVLPLYTTSSRSAINGQLSYLPELQNRNAVFPAPRDTILVGVLDLDASNLDPGEARVISDRLRYFINSQPIFQLIERAKMVNIMEEVGFQISGACDTDECVVQVGKILGARKMIAGSIGRVGTIYTLQVRIVDIESSMVEHQAFTNVSGIEDVLETATATVAKELADILAGQSESVQPFTSATIRIGTWAEKTSMPTIRWGPVAGVIGGMLYIVGGRNSGGNLGALEVYNPVADSWTTKVSMPTARYGAAAGVIGGKLYVAGGRAGGRDLSVLEVYDPGSDTWTVKASMPTGKSYAAGAVIDGRFYVAGGSGSNNSNLNTLITYDPASDSWTARASMPTAKRNGVVGVIDGKLFITGGLGSSNSSSTALEMYDPESDSWTTKASMMTGRSYAMAGVIDGRFYVAGGMGLDNSYLSIMEVYDPASDNWVTNASMLTTKYQAAVGVIDGRLYVAGGHGLDGFLKILEIFTP